MTDTTISFSNFEINSRFVTHMLKILRVFNTLYDSQEANDFSYGKKKTSPIHMARIEGQMH